MFINKLITYNIIIVVTTNKYELSMSYRQNTLHFCGLRVTLIFHLRDLVRLVVIKYTMQYTRWSCTSTKK